jgi:hypothetical protein
MTLTRSPWKWELHLCLIPALINQVRRFMYLMNVSYYWLEETWRGRGIWQIRWEETKRAMQIFNSYFIFNSSLTTRGMSITSPCYSRGSHDCCESIIFPLRILRTRRWGRRDYFSSYSRCFRLYIAADDARSLCNFKTGGSRQLKAALW